MGSALLTQISQVQLQIILYEEPVILVLGNLGNIINILTFTRRDLRKNVCSWYFICMSLAHLLLLDSFCLTRIVVTITGNDVFQYISSLCKSRAYALELSLQLSRYFLCLISIDRWMVTSSSAWLRQKSSIRVSRWSIICGVTFWTIYSLHVPIGYEPSAIQCTAPAGTPYGLFASIESIVTSLATILVMSVFSVLTVRNMRSRMNRQIHPTATNHCMPMETQQTIIPNAEPSRQRFKRNMQLVRLSLLQVILYLLLTSVWTFCYLYSFLTHAQALVSINQRLMLLFIGRLGLNLLFTYAAITFILYTLVSKAFRKECIVTFKQWFTIVQRRFLNIQ